jgi:V/A-type H+-transporting ATPase subunit I
MSQFTTESMSRLLLAGTRDQLPTTVRVVASLSAVHINDYPGDESGLTLGRPEEDSEEVSRKLTRLRSCAAQIEVDRAMELMPAPTVRRTLADSVDDLIAEATARFDELDAIEAEIGQIDEAVSVLSQLAPLSLELELLSGYDSVTAHIGTVRNLAKARTGLAALGNAVISVSSETGKTGVIAAFARNADSKAVQSILEESDFQPIQIPEGEGLPSAAIKAKAEREEALLERQTELEQESEAWSAANGGMLFGGMELLERDLSIHTAPVRVAVSEHAFIMDGWVTTRSADEVSSTLKSVCTFVDIEEFEAPSHHGHGDDDHAVEMPPIAFAPRKYSAPFEMLTDVMGRPEYGRIDPTIFMVVTYPLFFGMMLGDMAYGLAVVGLAVFMWKKFPLDDTMRNAAGFLLAIGLATVAFGYLYGEFAGFEFLPHLDGGVFVAAEGVPAWVSWMTVLYPNGGEIHYELTGYFGLVLAYPFHRVTANMEDLILLTIYMGVAHIFIGLVLGFRDIVKAHGWVEAIFEKGSWIVLLIGGFLFSYAFLVAPTHTDVEYLALLDTVFTVGLVMTGTGMVMVMVLLSHYEKMGWGIGIPMGVLESLGLLPKVVSYVRLFAVGVVGVKIAATGNEMLYPIFASTLSNLGDAGATDLVLLPIILIVWLLVQLFALVLGVFSPNIHTVRLHFVEWMMQFYEGSGLPFKPFGFKPGRVEIE